MGRRSLALAYSLLVSGCATPTPDAPMAPAPATPRLFFEQDRTLFLSPLVPVPDEPRVQALRWVSELSDDEPSRRDAATRQIRSLGPDFIPVLTQACARGDAETRARLGEILRGRQVDLDAIAGILRDLEIPGRLFDAAARLCDLLPGPDSAIDRDGLRFMRPLEAWRNIRASFRTLLTQRQREAIAQAFDAAMTAARGEERGQVGQYAVRCFWHLGGGREIDLIERWIQDPHGWPKWVLAINEIGGPRAAAALERLADDPTRRFWIVFAAADAPGPSPSLDLAKRILLGCRQAQLIRTGLPLARHLPDDERLSFLLALHDRLERIAAESPSESKSCDHARYTILRILSRLPAPEVRRVLEAALTSGDPWTSRQGILGLASRGDVAARARLKELLRGPDRGLAAYMELQLIDFPTLREEFGPEHPLVDVSWKEPREKAPYLYSLFTEQVTLRAESESMRANPGRQKPRFKASNEVAIPREGRPVDRRRDLWAWTLGTPEWDQPFLLDVCTAFGLEERPMPLGIRRWASNLRDNSLYGCEIEVLDRVRGMRREDGREIVEIDHEVRIRRDWRPWNNGSFMEMRAWGTGRSRFDRTRGILLEGNWRLASEETVSGSNTAGDWDAGLETLRIVFRD